VAASAFMMLEFMARNTIEGNGKFPPSVRRRLAGSETEIEFQMVSREGAVSSTRQTRERKSEEIHASAFRI
jgi:hypothetical protein